MPVSSLIVQTHTDQTKSVADVIEHMDGATVSAIEGENIVVVTDTPGRERDRVLWEKIEHISGVLKVDLIYHNFEDQEGKL